MIQWSDTEAILDEPDEPDEADSLDEGCGDPSCTTCDPEYDEDREDDPFVPDEVDEPTPEPYVADPGKSMADRETQCACEPCKAKRGDPHNLVSAAAAYHSYKPPVWRRHRVSGDQFPYFMGVELETQMKTRLVRRRAIHDPYDIDHYEPDAISYAFATGLARPDRFWIAKQDSSVTGPEFASHPATLPFWHSIKSQLTEMFDLLIHAGYRSHNGAAAGMHVNLSRNAFDDASHLGRFLDFLWMNSHWSQVISQRNDEQLQWCRIRHYSEDDANNMFEGDIEVTDKYDVLNAPYGERRFEFRLPRGTLRLDRFMKNVEWASAMVAYTRDESRDLMPTSFLGWATPLVARYPNLISFLDEKATELTYAMRRDRMEGRYA